METKIKKLSGTEKDRPLLEEAAALIRAGELVAFPTETVYGLGGNGLDPRAARRIYEAKGRPGDNPLILHVAGRDQIPPLVKEIPEAAEKLMEAFWPGPLTVIFAKSELVPPETTGGLETVAIRMPAHEGARAFLACCERPVAAPSANRSGRPSPTEAQAVWEDLQGRIPLILDGGPCDIGLESTIVDVSSPLPMLLRPGFYSLADLKRVLGSVAVDPATLRQVEGDEPPRAPGMKYRHYAPRLPLILVEGEDKARADFIISQAGPDRPLAVLVSRETLPLYAGADHLVLIPLGRREKDEEIARNLFGALRKIDESGAVLAYSESFEKGPIGAAIMNRLSKAAGYHIVRV